ncbi:MAG TPA: peptidase S10 [Phenylobacterium sp.]|jgi:carboxypeptidase C (cathepsin A)|uniref:S10 family serine carboxypeptidase-like protein n=1 Tax=Phenylobacterium sp. TaxID=1871053 RepID=UPI002D703A85|nr:peptidase S10 [Phenylobacterium sp.]HZZ68578.1 peptidase S10 [Phenylobacterium sp.]
MKLNASLAVAGLLAVMAVSGAHAATYEPLAPGDEPVVVTQHKITTSRGGLAYETRAGRIPIRNAETGEVRGHIFFTAYVVKQPPGAKPRPLTFAWNGGPTAPAVLVQTELLGPRRIEGAKFVDNAESLLYTSDLVFMDPVETGFSRPEKPEDAKEFLSTLGDFAATAEFIRAWRVKFAAEKQPLFLFGESYGTWRVNGATELLEKRGIKVSGAMLLSGGVPGSLMPFEFQDAYYIPARTATAFYYKRLAPDLMADRAATMKAVDAWVTDTYMPALAKVGELSDAEREKIAGDLARFTGIPASMVNRKTLVVSNRAYLQGFFGGDKSTTLNTYDMRIFGPEHEAPGYKAAIMTYLRGELGYRTDLNYVDLEAGYMPTPGPAARSTGSRWDYNHTTITPEMMAHMNAGGGPPASQPWLQNAMRQDPALKVFVAAGRYDSLNMCEGNEKMTGKLEPALSARFADHCYEGGHMMYRVQSTRLQLSKDLADFIKGASPP